MKKLLTIIAVLALGATALAQENSQPDAEYLLIRRSYKTYPNGSMDIRYRKEIRLIRNRAFTAYADKGETFITYNPAFENVKVNECYTLMADGTRVETPTNAFVVQLPSECSDCGRYSTLRELAIVHTALEYNCTIVLDYTLQRKSTLLAEQFDLNQDCPVRRYEIRYADGHTQVLENLPQTVNDPYMPAKKGHDVMFQLGDKPTYTAEAGLPQARKFVASLKKDDDLATITAIRDWVVDYVHLNSINPARVNYTMTPAAEVFQSNCGTAIDKTGLLAALLAEAGYPATIVDNSISVFGDQPLEVEVTVGGKAYRLSATAKDGIVTPKTANEQPEPVYIDRALEWKPDTLVDGYYRIVLPNENVGLKIDPARLAPSRTSDLQVSTASEFYHYTIELPKDIKLLGGDINIDYNKPDVGAVSVIVKQKGNKLIVTRRLGLRKSIITSKEYADFRQIMIDWNRGRELLFQTK